MNIPNSILPEDLVAAVMSLKFENPSDERFAKDAIMYPERATKATVAWLAALVKRKGVKYDDNNFDHKGPTTWPLE